MGGDHSIRKDMSRYQQGAVDVWIDHAAVAVMQVRAYLLASKIVRRCWAAVVVAVDQRAELAADVRLHFRHCHDVAQVLRLRQQPILDLNERTEGHSRLLSCQSSKASPARQRHAMVCPWLVLLESSVLSALVGSSADAAVVVPVAAVHVAGLGSALVAERSRAGLADNRPAGPDSFAHTAVVAAALAVAGPAERAEARPFDRVAFQQVARVADTHVPRYATNGQPERIRPKACRAVPSTGQSPT